MYSRDSFRCQYCHRTFEAEDLTIDHLIPVARGGLDEVTNYVTCCIDCNARKASVPLHKFAASINIAIEDLPIHGDPVIDNEALPIQLRLLRKRLFDEARHGRHGLTGGEAQKKLEKAYRREFWQTPEGRAMQAQFPLLPGHARIMLHEIRAIAKTSRDYRILVELAKSAHTRNLIGTVLTPESDIPQSLISLSSRSRDDGLKRRIRDALRRAGEASSEGS